MQTIEARAILSASDKTGGVFSQIASKIRGMNAAAATANKSALTSGAVAANASRVGAANASRMGAAMDGMIVAASRVAAPAAIVAAGAKAVKRFSEVDLAMKRIGNTAEASDEEIATFYKGLRQVATDTSLSFDNVKGGMDSLTAGGMELADANKMIGTVSKTAQAAGADVSEMATTVLALNQNSGIEADKMQSTLDSLAKAGKLGKFEFKDMARYLPSILPAAKAVGTAGEEGVQKVAAALQIMRLGAGTSEEAATNMQNVFSKMNSEETSKKFKKMGIDLPDALKKAKEAGKDALETFVELSQQATKGDLSKLPLLFQDMQVQAGMRAMLQNMDKYKQMLSEIRGSTGTIDRDFNRVVGSSAAKIEQTKQQIDRLVVAIGGGLVSALDAAANAGSKLLGGKGGTGGIAKLLSDKAAEVEDKGLKGLLPEDDQRIIEFASSERKQIETMLAKREAWGTKDDDSVRKRRLRLEDLKAGERVDEMQAWVKKNGLFSDKEVATWKKSGDGESVDTVAKVPGQATRLNGQTPVPTADPRKPVFGEAPPMPAVQGLESAASSLQSAASALESAAAKPASAGSEAYPPLSTPASPQEVKVESTVTGEIQGSVPVQVTIDSSGLASWVQGVNAKLSAALSAVNSATRMGNGPGSTGRSAPDAAPRNAGAGGL